VTVGIERWGDRSSTIKWSAQTGPDGRLEWNSAPRDEPFELYAVKDGYCYTRDIRLKADGNEHLITVHEVLHVSGSVVDDDTGQPIPEFKAIPGYGGVDRFWDPGLVWYRSEVRRGRNGRYELPLIENVTPLRVRIEAEGYEPGVSDPLPLGGQVTFDFALQRRDPSRGVRGQLRLPDGGPAGGAQVVLLTLEHSVTLNQGRFEGSSVDLLVTADAQGRFSIRRDPKAHSLAVVSDAGIARIRVRDFSRPLSVELQAWGRIEGVVRVANLPPSGAYVTLADRSADQYRGCVHFGVEQSRAEIHPRGAFAIDRVPPGRFYVYFDRGPGIPHSFRTAVDVQPGRVAHVEVGGTGRTVTGHLLPEPGRVKNWTKEAAYAAFKGDNERIPRPKDLTGDALAFWEVDYWESEAGRGYLERNESYGLALSPDGSFRVEGVPPGVYKLLVVGSDFSLEREVVIPIAEEGDAMPVDLGTVTTQSRPGTQR
jgi:hypothetical protein